MCDSGLVYGPEKKWGKGKKKKFYSLKGLSRKLIKFECLGIGL